MSLDREIFSALNGLAIPWLDAAWVVLSHRGFGLAAGLVFCALLVLLQRRRAVLSILAGLAAVAASDLIGARVLKPLFARQRPSFALPEEMVRVLAPAANTGSLPSNHAANTFALALIVTLADRRLAAPAYLVAVLVSLSRVGVGVHWPSDLLAGAALGTAVAAATWAAAQAIRRRWEGRRSRTSS